MKINAIPADVVTILESRLQDLYNSERFNKAASIWCDLNGFPCASKYFVDEYHEKRRHQHKIEKHMSDYGVRASLPTVSIDPTFASLKDIVYDGYDMESKLLEALGEALKMVEDEYPTCSPFIEKFIKIQDKCVIAYADMIKKFSGVNDEFEVRAMERKIFK